MATTAAPRRSRFRRARTAAGLAALLLTLSPAAAGAAVTMVDEAGSPYPTGLNPLGVTAADFNGDQALDLAAVNSTSSNVSTFVRVPGAAFAQDPGSPFGVGSGPNHAAAADFNGDGRTDLAVSNYAGSSVTILLRLANGGFTPEGPPLSLAKPSAIAVGAWDTDGRPDLAVTLRDTHQVAFLTRTPGGFAAPVVKPTGTWPSQLAVADFNNDGLSDTAIANNGSDNVTVLFRVPGDFVPFTPPLMVGDQPRGILARDLTGDARPDLAVSNFGSDNVSVFTNNATGPAFVPTGGSQFAVGDGPIGVAAGDLDGEGRPDLAVANNTGGGISVLRQSDLGSFAPDGATIPAIGHPYGVAAANLGGDGKSDLAVTDDAASLLRVFRNTTGTAAPPDDGGGGTPQPPAPQPGTPVAQLSISPSPSCIGLSTKFDASGSSSPNGPITRYRLEYTERYWEGTVSQVDHFRQVVIADGPNAVSFRTFDWNLYSSTGGTGRGGEGADRLADPDIRAASTRIRDPADLVLTVTDATGAQATTTQRLNFQDPCSSPIPSDVFVPLRTTAISTTVSQPKLLTIVTDCPGIVSCLGTARVTSLRSKTLVASAARPVVVASGQFAVGAGQRGSVRLKVTRKGRRLLRKTGRHRVKVALATRSPNGKTTTKSRTVTFRVRRR